MGQFIVSARKYRPNNFESLIGQENIARTLKNSILRNQLAHAYLFCGPRGVGKTSAARVFAKTINCSNPTEDMEPCGCCESCLSFAEGRSYSIHELDAASNNSVEDIRTLTDQVRIPPQIGKYSVYIIDEVHMLSQQAFNAFLKTLEEPPAHAIFILATTEKHKILPTILSRCQTYDFNRISVENIVRHLRDIAAREEVTVSDDALHILAQKADGAMRDALTLFDQTVAFCGREITFEQVIRNLNVLDYEYYFKLTECFMKGDHTTALLTFDEILSRGFNAQHFISGLSTHLRDLIVSKDGASQSLAELAPTIAQRYREVSQNCPSDFLFEALNCSTTCEAGYRQSGNPRLLIEFTLMKICRIVATQANAAQVAAQPHQAAPASAQAAPAAPAAPATPATPAAPATSRKSSGLSIKDLMNQVKQAPAAEAAQSATRMEPQEAVEFTKEAVAAIWPALAESEAKMPRLSSAISSAEPVVDIDEKAVHFYVGNKAQKEWIDRNCRARLESFIQHRLSDRSIRLFVDVKEVEQSARKELYMPSDKANYLQQNSPEFVELKKELQLEIK